MCWNLLKNLTSSRHMAYHILHYTSKSAGPYITCSALEVAGLHPPATTRHLCYVLLIEGPEKS